MIDKLKDMATSVGKEVMSNLANLPSKYSMTYDAGLPDVKGPKPMTLIFANNKLTISYLGFFIFQKKIYITPNDILELDLGVQNVDQTANAMTGAMAGNILGGSLGALGLASLNSKRKREDHLHLVIKYNGQARTIYFQSNNNFQKVYAKLKAMTDLRATPLKNKIAESSANNLSPVNNIDYTARLTELHSLLEKGILTQSEFDAKKTDILSKM